jgi:hypothetical protein
MTYLCVWSDETGVYGLGTKWTDSEGNVAYESYHISDNWLNRYPNWEMNTREEEGDNSNIAVLNITIRGFDQIDRLKLRVSGITQYLGQPSGVVKSPYAGSIQIPDGHRLLGFESVKASGILMGIGLVLLTPSNTIITTGFGTGAMFDQRPFLKYFVVPGSTFIDQVNVWMNGTNIVGTQLTYLIQGISTTGELVLPVMNDIASIPSLTASVTSLDGGKIYALDVVKHETSGVLMGLGFYATSKYWTVGATRGTAGTLTDSTSFDVVKSHIVGFAGFSSGFGLPVIGIITMDSDIQCPGCINRDNGNGNGGKGGKR